MKQFHISHVYNTDLGCEGICDRKGSDRVYIYAALNPLRYSVSKRLDMKQSNFQLSTSYVLYYILLSRAQTFIEAYKSSGEREILLKTENLFEGSFFDVQRIVSKYGIAPLSAMPDRSCSHDNDVCYYLDNYLRYAASCIDKGREEDFEKGIKKILFENLGTPPESFDLKYMDKTDEIKTLEGLTPLEFYKNYCGVNLDDYEALENSDETRLRAVKQLEDGDMVTVFCDIRHQSTQMLGVLDTELIDNSDMFANDVNMTRDEKIKYGIIKGNYYLTLDGAEVIDGDALRFKAQDCNGADTGADGHYTMSRDWFDEYVLYAVIKK
ncbi:MAG: hypothetical protein IJT65_02270 [Eubacterium sp.]|nr:hypothetical protein [Eubacterium sp.]